MNFTTVVKHPSIRKDSCNHENIQYFSQLVSYWLLRARLEYLDRDSAHLSYRSIYTVRNLSASLSKQVNSTSRPSRNSGALSLAHTKIFSR